jgi:hypothetical protein
LYFSDRCFRVSACPEYLEDLHAPMRVWALTLTGSHLGCDHSLRRHGPRGRPDPNAGGRLVVAPRQRRAIAHLVRTVSLTGQRTAPSQRDTPRSPMSDLHFQVRRGCRTRPRHLTGALRCITDENKRRPISHANHSIGWFRESDCRVIPGDDADSAGRPTRRESNVSLPITPRLRTYPLSAAGMDDQIAWGQRL